MTNIADKYITPSGRTASYDRDALTEDIMTLGVFLAWAEEDGAIFGAVNAKDALRSMCRILDVDPKGLRKAIMVEE
tara:strand:+ start:147 stop:374 length:228 start_codon:yes stop_codon:yes gene_type:complete